MSLPGEVGKVASSAIDALKSQPMLLVFVFLQLATLALIYGSVQRSQDRAHERELLLLRSCFSGVDEDRR